MPTASSSIEPSTAKESAVSTPESLLVYCPDLPRSLESVDKWRRVQAKPGDTKLVNLSIFTRHWVPEDLHSWTGTDLQSQSDTIIEAHESDEIEYHGMTLDDYAKSYGEHGQKYYVLKAEMLKKKAEGDEVTRHIALQGVNPRDIELSSKPDKNHNYDVETLRDTINSIRSEPDGGETQAASGHPYKATVGRYVMALRDKHQAMEEEQAKIRAWFDDYSRAMLELPDVEATRRFLDKAKSLGARADEMDERIDHFLKLWGALCYAFIPEDWWRKRWPRSRTTAHSSHAEPH